MPRRETGIGKLEAPGNIKVEPGVQARALSIIFSQIAFGPKDQLDEFAGGAFATTALVM